MACQSTIRCMTASANLVGGRRVPEHPQERAQPGALRLHAPDLDRRARARPQGPAGARRRLRRRPAGRGVRAARLRGHRRRPVHAVPRGRARARPRAGPEDRLPRGRGGESCPSPTASSPSSTAATSSSTSTTSGAPSPRSPACSEPGGVFLYDTINRTRRSRLLMIKVSQEWKAPRPSPIRTCMTTTCSSRRRELSAHLNSGRASRSAIRSGSPPEPARRAEGDVGPGARQAQLRGARRELKMKESQRHSR